LDDPFFFNLSANDDIKGNLNNWWLDEVKSEKNKSIQLDFNFKSLTNKLHEYIQSKREDQFQSQVMSKLQLRKMMKALEKTKHKQVLSSLILSPHNPLSYNLPQIVDPENRAKMLKKATKSKIFSCFQNIFNSKYYSKTTGVASIDSDMQRDGASHHIYISERLVVPSLRSKIFHIKPQSVKVSSERKQRLVNILDWKVGFIHLVNQYEQK